MSVIVAIKDGDNVIIGADSQVTKGGTRITLRNPNNFKIWNVRDVDHCLMASVGNLRDANVIRLLSGLIDDYDIYCDRVNYRFVVKRIVPEIISELKEYGYLKADKYVDFLDSSYLFAYKDQLYSIGSDCSVIEIDDCVAIGSGANEALGSLLSTDGLPTRERIIRAIKASAASDIYVAYPIVITDTAEGKFDIITEDEEKKYLKKISGKDTK